MVLVVRSHRLCWKIVRLFWWFARRKRRKWFIIVLGTRRAIFILNFLNQFNGTLFFQSLVFGQFGLLSYFLLRVLSKVLNLELLSNWILLIHNQIILNAFLKSSVSLLCSAWVYIWKLTFYYRGGTLFQGRALLFRLRVVSERLERLIRSITLVLILCVSPVANWDALTLWRIWLKFDGNFLISLIVLWLLVRWMGFYLIFWLIVLVVKN